MSNKLLKIKKLLRLDFITNPDTFKVYRSKSYDSRVKDFFFIENNEDNKYSDYLKGLFSFLWSSIVVLLLNLLYIVFLFLTSLIFIRNYKFYNRVKNDMRIYGYMKKYSHRPAFCYFKILEGCLFHEVQIKSPSVEIGVEDGKVSKLHFRDQKIDVGVEYMPPKAVEALGGNTFREVIAMDIRKPAFSNGTFKTVLFVHIFDHFNEIDEVLKNSHELMRENGEIIFSTFTDNLNKNILTNIINIFSKKLAIKYKKKFEDRRSIFNLFSKDVWVDKLIKRGFKIKKTRLFLGGKISLFWHFSNFGFEAYAATAITNLIKKN